MPDGNDKMNNGADSGNQDDAPLTRGDMAGFTRSVESLVAKISSGGPAGRTQNGSRQDGGDDGSRKAQPKKRYTRAELQQQVDNGTITEAQMDAILENQIRDETREEARRTAQDVIKGDRAAAEIEEILDSYREKVPAAWQDGSDERKRVEGEYRRLVARGFPESPATEATALEMAFGPVKSIAKGQNRADPHEEVGGEGGSDGGAGGDGAPKELTRREREYYKQMIDRRMYTGWDDPKLKSELKRRNPDRAKRYAA